MTRSHRLLGLVMSAGLWLACTKQPPRDAGTQTGLNKPVADSVRAVETREYRDGVGKIRVVYQTDEAILAMRISGQDTSRVLLPGVFQPAGAIGCDSCLLINDEGTFTRGGGYAVNDRLFLLTTAGTDGRALLFGINFNAKTLLKTSGSLSSDHLETYLDAFVYTTSNRQFIISNSLTDYNEQLDLEKVALNRYKIQGNQFIPGGQFYEPVPTDIRDNPAAMTQLLNQLAQRKTP